MNQALKQETRKTPAGRLESLGAILVRRGALAASELERVLGDHPSSGRKLGELLLEHRLVDPDDVVAAVAEQLGIPCLRGNDLIQPEASALELLGAADAAKYRALPLAVEPDGRLRMAMVDPMDLVARDDLAKITGKRVSPVVCAEELLAKTIEVAYAAREAEAEEAALESAVDHNDVNLDNLKERVEEAPIVKLVNSLIVKALRDRASDIHVEPQKKRLKVRYRVDGVLYPLASVSRDLAPVVTSRIKVLADMDIAERRLPQDGRFTVVFDKNEVDLRVSSLPGIFGEKIVMRLLVKDSIVFDFDELGVSAAAQAVLRRHIARPQGMVLLTGPTGSGKTTTLYTCLSEIDRTSLNVVTLEDPVEYQLAGIHQVHINQKIGLSFAAGLRTILRQDPDVVMIGEIRDKETAEMAIRAALTGHLVLSTLHTNDAMGTLTRLINMGIEPFLVTEATTLVGAQRLVRANCNDCPTAYDPDPAVLERFGLQPGSHRFLHGAGCARCRNIGYRGRVAVTEFAEMTPGLRELVLRGEPAMRLREAGVAAGMITLRQDGLEKALAGLTTLEEILRVFAEN
jgi:type II secretory ATPase GspE/PulE/Tfp pilus assembly ATPase PilB-like protein